MRNQRSPLHNDALEFMEFAYGTRPDFHEPDEQGIEFIGLTGSVLDASSLGSIDDECVLRLKREKVNHDETEREYRFNLANIFALAKIGAACVLATDGVLELPRN